MKRAGAWLARVSVGLKPDILDPQGKVVRGALGELGFSAVQEVRVGKHFWVRLRGSLSRPAAEREVRRMAARVLINPVIETFTFTLSRAG
ncbi:MAG: phosphoribosylformylglycinamidine synthase subunit PurS [Candidatus Coatesbacteria bacterium]